MSTTEEEKPTIASETPEVAAETSTKEEEKKATPTPEEGSLWSKIYKFIDWAALNVGKAKQK